MRVGGRWYNIYRQWVGGRASLEEGGKVLETNKKGHTEMQCSSSSGTRVSSVHFYHVYQMYLYEKLIPRNVDLFRRPPIFCITP